MWFQQLPCQRRSATSAACGRGNHLLFGSFPRNSEDGTGGAPTLTWLLAPACSWAQGGPRLRPAGLALLVGCQGAPVGTSAPSGPDAGAGRRMDAASPSPGGPGTGPGTGPMTGPMTGQMSADAQPSGPVDTRPADGAPAGAIDAAPIAAVSAGQRRLRRAVRSRSGPPLRHRDHARRRRRAGSSQRPTRLQALRSGALSLRDRSAGGHRPAHQGRDLPDPVQREAGAEAEVRRVRAGAGLPRAEAADPEQHVRGSVGRRRTPVLPPVSPGAAAGARGPTAPSCSSTASRTACT